MKFERNDYPNLLTYNICCTLCAEQKILTVLLMNPKIDLSELGNIVGKEEREKGENKGKKVKKNQLS